MPTIQEFESFSDTLDLDAVNIFAEKNKEYASEDNCFVNFTQLALDMSLKPEQVAMVYAHKHWRSIQEAIRSGRYDYRVETLRGRIIDMINYLHVIAYMCEERIKEKNDKLQGSTQ